MLASKMLALRPLSANMLFDKLIEKEVSDEDAQSAVEYMIRIGAVDDVEYARRIATTLSQRYYGEYRIRRELRSRGIDDEDADIALGELPDPVELIITYAGMKLRGATADDKALSKLAASLNRRGFGWDDIKTAMMQLDT